MDESDDGNLLTCIESGLDILDNDDREKPLCTSSRYHDIHNEAFGLAYRLGYAAVIDALGRMPPQYAVGDYSATNHALRRILRTKLKQAREALLTTTETKPRFSAVCQCGAKLYVRSTRKAVRHVYCRKCGFRGTRPV